MAVSASTFRASILGLGVHIILTTQCVVMIGLLGTTGPALAKHAIVLVGETTFDIRSSTRVTVKLVPSGMKSVSREGTL